MATKGRPVTGGGTAPAPPRWYRRFVIGSTAVAVAVGWAGYALSHRDVDPALALLAYVAIPTVVLAAVWASLSGWPRASLLAASLLDVEALAAAARFAVGPAFAVLLPLVGLVLVLGVLRGRALAASFAVAGAASLAAMLIAVTVGPVAALHGDSSPEAAILAAGVLLGFALVHVGLVVERRSRAVDDAEAELASRRAAEEELARTSRLLSAIVDSAPVSIQALRADGTVMVWNRASERLFGWPAEEVLGRRRPDGLVPPDEAAASDDRMRRALAGEPIQGERVRRRARDGRERILEVYAGRMADSDGAAVGVASHLVDVTERDALEAQLRQQQKMEAIGQLSGGVAHDFNNMLTAIRGHAELARAGADQDDAELLEDLAEIVRSADRASDLTRQLLAFARKSSVDPRVLEPGAAVREIAPMLRRLLGERVDLELEADPAAGRVRADRAQLDQLVLNLAVNARDAMPEGGRLSIGVRDVVAAAGRAGPPGPFVEIAVSDTGHGMDAATQARIFEPFFTTKAPGSGTGMGLATVFGIVSMAGGSVSVDSAPGAGSTFRVLLPRIPDAPELREEAEGRRASGGSETVLLVEDEPAVRALARRVLVGLGYAVIEAGRGDDALAAAEAHDGRIALLVTDVVLPGMQGPELAELLAERRPDMAVLFCSGYNELDTATLAIRGRRYLSKPYTVDDLAREARLAIEGRGTAADA